jgi:hypothetical protein
MLGCVRGARRYVPMFAGATAAVIALHGEAHADSLHVRVRGASRIEAQGVRDSGAMKLRGVLVDDASAPLAREGVELAVSRPGGGRALAVAGATSCETSTDAHADSDGSARVTTDDAGRFCLRIVLPIDRYVVQARYAGSAYVDASSTNVDVDLSRRSCTLAFTPPPRSVSLDAHTLLVVAAATLESDGQVSAGSGLPLTLGSERGPVATATTDPAGVARFTIDPTHLGPPGQGELRVSFAGSADAAAATRTSAIERRARVSIETDVPEGRLPAAAPEDGVPLTVRAVAAGAAVSGGSVEARVGDVVVGAGPVEDGTAKLVAAFGISESMGASRDVTIGLRYVANAPWLEPGTDASLLLPVRARSPWRQWPLMLAALALAAWFVASRTALQLRARTVTASAPRAAKPAPGVAKLDLVKRGSAGEGWRGRVVDADDGSAVAAAVVRVERPAFGRAEIVASAASGEDGSFDLAHVATRSGDELAIEAPLHVSLRRALPPAGELDVQLVLRKRALLTRLVAWAKARGRPFDGRSEPTPGHVRRVAGQDLRVARWADAVERAAFEGGPVDARAEEEIDRLAPEAGGASSKEASLDARALANPTKHNA